MKKQDTPPGLPNDNREHNSDTRSAWNAWFKWVTTACNSIVDSGTTANRPVKLLWAGRPYFDTTLNAPIWYDGTKWIAADGTAV